MSNLELQAGTEISGSRLELHVQPDTSGMSGTPDVKADVDSDPDPHNQPDDRDQFTSGVA